VVRLYNSRMDDSLLAILRCPLDPAREATLTRDQQSLVCSGCHARFPIKQGIPVLTPDQAELPPGIRSPDRLPCIQAAAAAHRTRRGN
jgi:uncharacterized protein YbaR (Trm112 family)